MARRPGFTLPEALVVMGVLAVLASLALPALGAARAAAQAADCKSRLHGLALAATAYHDVHRTLPAWLHNVHESGPSDQLFDSMPSIHAQLLPFLEQAAVYDEINFRRPIHHEFLAVFGGFHHMATVAGRTIPAFLCPADGGSGFPGGGTNYRACLGVGPMWHRTALFPDSHNGVFASTGIGGGYPVRFAGVIDGMSRSAMFSERLKGSARPDAPDRARDSVEQPAFEAAGVGDADAEQRVCAALNRLAPPSYANLGKYWCFTGQHHTLYVHVLPPNAAISDCLANTLLTVPMGAVSARSLHPGTVHAAMADGAVHAVSEDVAPRIWRALGSRNGGEGVGLSE